MLPITRPNSSNKILTLAGQNNPHAKGALSLTNKRKIEKVEYGAYSIVRTKIMRQSL